MTHPDPLSLWLDDLRPAPTGWLWVKSVAEAIAALATGTVEHASLDHDLGHGCEGGCLDDSGDVVRLLCGADCQCECHRTGYDLVKWMAEWNVWPTRSIRVHSTNPSGAANMRATIARYAPEHLRR